MLLLSNHTTTFQGDSVVLTCIGYAEPNFDIIWTRNNQTIVNSSLVSVTEWEFVQAGRIVRQSFLQLCDVRIEDTGAYTCTVTNGIISADGFARLSLVGMCSTFGNMSCFI